MQMKGTPSIRLGILGIVVIKEVGIMIRRKSNNF